MYIYLYIYSVALVVLLGDGIDSLFPGYTVVEIRVFSFIILTPMLFLPVRHLSYTSLLGIFSAFSIIIVIIVDGVGKKDAPGSLIEPAVSKKKITVLVLKIIEPFVSFRKPKSGLQIGLLYPLVLV